MISIDCFRPTNTTLIYLKKKNFFLRVKFKKLEFLNIIYFLRR